MCNNFTIKNFRYFMVIIKIIDLDNFTKIVLNDADFGFNKLIDIDV